MPRERHGRRYEEPLNVPSSSCYSGPFKPPLQEVPPVSLFRRWHGCPECGVFVGWHRTLVAAWIWARWDCRNCSHPLRFSGPWRILGAALLGCAVFFGPLMLRRAAFPIQLVPVLIAGAVVIYIDHVRSDGQPA
jgi:hypothetical protein